MEYGLGLYTSFFSNAENLVSKNALLSSSILLSHSGYILSVGLPGCYGDFVWLSPGSSLAGDIFFTLLDEDPGEFSRIFLHSSSFGIGALVDPPTVTRFQLVLLEVGLWSPLDSIGILGVAFFRHLLIQFVRIIAFSSSPLHMSSFVNVGTCFIGSVNSLEMQFLIFVAILLVVVECFLSSKVIKCLRSDWDSSSLSTFQLH
jgi:hypothetical protein